MGDLERNLFLNLGGHVSASTGLRERYGLDSTADSREQSQKAPRRSLTTQLKTSSLARFGTTKQTSNAQHPTLNAQFSTSELDACWRKFSESEVER